MNKREQDELTEVLSSTDDLDQVIRLVARERAIRNTMARTGETREIVASVLDAAISMDHEEVLSLTEGEPTTLADGLRRYVNDLESRHGDYVSPTTVVEELDTLMAYPWPSVVKTVRTMPPGFHRCPGICDDRVVPDSIYACVDCWLALPQRAKAWLYSTGRLSVLNPERRGAIEFARRAWNMYLIRQNAG